MYKQFENIKSITFPIYRLRSKDWIEQDKVLFLEDKVLDDKNMSGATIGIRRIQCQRDDLFKLKKAYPDFASMLACKTNTFIDNAGVPFIYHKTRRSPLKYHRVKEILRREVGTTVWLDNAPCAFPLPRPPYGDARWARVLYLGNNPWIIYDFCTEKGKDSFRRV